MRRRYQERRRRPPGFVMRGGIPHVWDLTRDEYVPLRSARLGPTDIGEMEVAAVDETAEGLAPENLDRHTRAGRYEEPTKRHPRAGG
jgi:hypothetical protein